MPSTPCEPKLSPVDAYLQHEASNGTRHEYFDGKVCAIPDPSRNHSRISGNLWTAFGNHLKDSCSESFAINMKVKAGMNFFYPDVMVVCEEQNPNEYYTNSPIIIVEVLSKTTRRMDETTKRLAYFNIASLQEYILIEQDIVDVEICRRKNGWVSEHFFMGDELVFELIGLNLSVEEIYARVENDDVKTYLEEKRLSAEQSNSTNTDSSRPAHE